MNLIIIFAAKYLIYASVIFALFAFFFTKKTNKKETLKLSLIALPAAFLTAKILGHLIHTTRPFVTQNSIPLITHAKNNGFPSDHTLLAMTIAAIFFASDKKTGYIFLILGLVIGLARILAKVHQPVDVMASILIAFAAVFLTHFALRKAHHLNSTLDRFLQKV